MDWLTFIAQLVGACAWPITIVTIFLFLRKPLSELLLELRRLKWRDIEAEFGKKLHHARELIEQEPKLPSVTSGEFSSEKRSRIIELAELSPRSVILESWREVEAAANRYILRKGIVGAKKPNMTIAFNGKKLADLGALKATEFQIFSILRHLRNQAAHDPKFEITKADAVEYAIMAQSLATTIDAKTPR